MNTIGLKPRSKTHGVHLAGVDRPSSGTAVSVGKGVGVEIVLHDDVDEFARLARPLLDADPLRHTITLTVLDGMCRAGEPAAALLTAHDVGGAVLAALLRSPGWPALVSGVPPALAAPVEAALADVDPDLPGASGPVVEAEAFAAAHCRRTGAQVHVDMRMRLHALDELLPPVDVPGAARPATADDLDLLGEWLGAFTEEAMHGVPDADPPREQAVRSLGMGDGQHLWEIDGVPVALAVARSPVAGMSRIGPVYTPPVHRCHGYGAAVTAAATQWALERGADRVLLFTDLTNPTTNALYPRIGFAPVHDALELSFRRG